MPPLVGAPQVALGPIPMYRHRPMCTPAGDWNVWSTQTCQPFWVCSGERATVMGSGAPAPIPVGGVEIAIRAGAAIVPVVLHRNDRRVRAVVYPEMTYSAEAPRDVEARRIASDVLALFERVIRAGDLVIESAGERGQQMFTDIPRPMHVQNEVYRQIEAAQQRDADRMAGRRELSVPEQLEKLDELRQRGVISQAEFDAKKSQLLDRM